MLRVSDVWERALHAPGVAVATPDELESAIALSLPERLADLDDCPLAGETTPPLSQQHAAAPAVPAAS